MASQNRSKKVSLASDIQVMLWGLGDSQTPLLSTAKMIDIVVKKRIDLLILKADKVPKRRNSSKIDVKDVLFAMKDDKSKLSRLLEYLDLKDSLEMNVDDKRMSGFIDFSKSLEQKHNLSKVAALRFLSEIGVNDIEDYMKNDGIVMERKIRADRISRSLDVEDYMEFTKSRALSFVTPASKRNKFIEWLRSDNNTAAKRLKKCTIDVLAYLAKDTIAELVDLVLFHRKNGRIDVNDLKKPKGDMFTTISMLTATVDKLQEDLSPITPKEIKIAAIHLR